MFEEQIFIIPELKGISQKTIEEHIKLYQGYVKHANLILEALNNSPSSLEASQAYAISEMQRRFAFEFDGMRNHEFYFRSLENGSAPIDTESPLAKAIEKEFGSFDAWLARFKTIAKTRGVGWAILYFDPHTKHLINGWIDEQHMGHLTGLSPILTLDMWEHSFVADYQPSGKSQYIDDFFANLNWNTVERNYSDVGAL